jgi:hypothetical protein
MSKILKVIEAKFINRHFDELIAARERAVAVDTGAYLGNAMHIRLLAATGAESIESLIQSAKVVKRLKRAALIQVGNLLYYANRWGVMWCHVPSTIPIGIFNCEDGPGLCWDTKRAILDRLKVTSTYAGKGEDLFDYSNCDEEGWH